MKITALTAQRQNPDRVNVMIDGAYRFSLDVFQVTDLGIKVGRELSEAELSELENESQFGKLYARALEYSLVRPRSVKELRDYLYRKSRPARVRSKKTGTLVERPGASKETAGRVLERLVDKGYVDDEKFTRYWIENRNVTKGASARKLRAELAAKGVDRQLIERIATESPRSDSDELRKIIARKRDRYSDDMKFMQYLVRQGFSYDDVKSALREDEA